ncbi:MAG: pyridoxamine 5'-phosphate oxidase family protein [Candidatus Bathyarchaeota archaeon]|nr:pyridoxamine 5'-phosphate oxidase family protein [Candidatus Bathyarchaeota archaeon]
MRRKDLEITDERVLKKILRSTKYVTFALSIDNQPYLVSLSHGYDENRNCIYFHCAAEGKKLDYLKTNNVVWGQALLDHGYSEGECDHRYASVHFSGKVTFIDKLDEKRLAIKCMISHLDRNPEALMSRLLDSEELKSTIVGRVDIDYMSGKKSEKVDI